MTTLVEEEPYAAVVKDNFISITCSNCFAWKYDQECDRVNLSRCAACRNIVYCSKKCQKEDWELHKAECKFFRSVCRDHFPGEITRLVFRMIMKHKSQPDFKAFNGQTYNSLMKSGKPSNEPEEVMANAKKAFTEIKAFMGAKTPSFKTIRLIVSKYNSAAFSICDSAPVGVVRGIAFYLGLSVHQHRCIPDAFFISKGSKLLLRTTKTDCVYSDKLTISYESGAFFRDANMRRIHLNQNYQFFCHCEECLDLEANKKLISGRPICCPEGWFYADDLRCSICDKEVPAERAEMVNESNAALRFATIIFETFYKAGNCCIDSVGEWIELYETHKKVLSNENTLLIGMADMIYNTMLNFNFQISIKYANICLPLIRQYPYNLKRATFFCSRYMLYEMAAKPILETKQALDEAIETVEIVYGKDHELTLLLHEKKIRYDLAAMRV